MVEDNITPFTPLPGVAQTQTLTQRHLDEAARALGRPLWDYEVKILDEIVTVQQKVNAKLARVGKANQGHSMDEVVHVFCQRVLTLKGRKLADDIMSDHGAKKAKVYKELTRIANGH